MKRRFSFASRPFKLSANRRKLRQHSQSVVRDRGLIGPWRFVASVVAVAILALGLSVDPGSPGLSSPASADNQTETYQVRVPPLTRSVAAFNYENRTTRVRVPPLTRSVAAFNYENRTTRVRVPPLTRSVAAFHYENRTTRVRVAPLTRSVAAFNYENRTTRVRVAPLTRSVAAFNYENRTTRVRVAPLTRSVAAFNYENRTTRVRVAPLTRSVAAFNYENRTTRVRVAPYTRTVAAYNYENRTTRVRVAPYTRTVAAYNYENRRTCRPPRGCSTTRVRVAPFTRSVAAFHYENRTTRVRVAPLTRSVAAFHYENRTTRVRVAPLTRSVAAFNYENRTTRVRVAPLTRSVAAFNYENRTTRVRVAPFTRSVAAFHYENRTTRVRVAPLTRSVAAFNYENRTTRVRVAPLTRSVAAFHYENRTTRVRVPPLTRSVAAFHYENRTTRVRVAPFTRSVAAFHYATRTRRVTHTHPTTTTTAPSGCAGGQHEHLGSAETEQCHRTDLRHITTTTTTTAPPTTTAPQSRPSPVTGLECIASSHDRLTANWNAVAGADSYRLSTTIRAIRGPRRVVVGDLGRGAATSDSISGLSDGAVYTLRVVAYNSEGNSEAATVRCRTVNDDWLDVECSAGGVLTAGWSDPSGDDPDPSGYTATVSLSGSGVIHSYSGTSTNTQKTVALGGQYQVSLRSGDGNGGPVYTQTKTRTCPNPPTTTTTAPPRVVAAPTDFEAVCSANGISMSWDVVPSMQALSPQRKFNVEVNGEVVGVVSYNLGNLGLENIVYIWGDVVGGETYTVRVKELSKESLNFDDYVNAEWVESPWTAAITVPCALFVPRNFEVSCNSHGVVSAEWEELGGASFYRVKWLPQHEAGSNRTLIFTSNSFTRQGDEGGAYNLQVRALHSNGWSDHSDQTVTCAEVTYPGGAGPISFFDSDLSFNGFVLRTRFCPTRSVNGGTERICTEIWDEHVTIRVDQRSWWRRIPLTQWNDIYDIAQNAITLGTLYAAIRTRQRYPEISRVSIGTVGGAQTVATLRATENERVYLSVSSYSNGSSIVGCIPNHYSQESIELDRMTYRTDNHTTHRDVTVYYCHRD